MPDPRPRLAIARAALLGLFIGSVIIWVWYTGVRLVDHSWPQLVGVLGFKAYWLPPRLHPYGERPTPAPTASYWILLAAMTAIVVVSPWLTPPRAPRWIRAVALAIGPSLAFTAVTAALMQAVGLWPRWMYDGSITLHYGARILHPHAHAGWPILAGAFACICGVFGLRRTPVEPVGVASITFGVAAVSLLGVVALSGRDDGVWSGYHTATVLAWTAGLWSLGTIAAAAWSLPRISAPPASACLRCRGVVVASVLLTPVVTAALYALVLLSLDAPSGRYLITGDPNLGHYGRIDDRMLPGRAAPWITLFGVWCGTYSMLAMRRDRRLATK